MQPIKLASALALMLGLSATQAHAQLVITPTFDSTWSADTNAAADEATITNLLANTYDKAYTNPITVAIDFSDVNTGLGTSLTGYYTNSYSNYSSALTADKSIAKGGDGNTAFLSSLPASGNPVPGNGTAGVQFTSAQGRALGFNTPGAVTIGTGTFDSQISLNMSLIGPNSGPNGGYSLSGVSEHEINEVLGVGSALDGAGDTPGTATAATVGAMDFFRYSAPGVRSFTSDSKAQSYFSDDGGVTKIVSFNQQTGADYHDWASAGDATDGIGVDGLPQVQDAFSTPNVKSNTVLGPSEFEALNDVGYNSAAPPIVPEAASSVSFGGLLALGGLVIARRRKAAGKAA